MLPKKISTFKKLAKLNNIKVYCLCQVSFLIDSVPSVYRYFFYSCQKSVF